jgi:type II secretory pathway pseudopilin PulG
VIIGILAAIAIPKFEGTKGQALVATMKSDLRNLATAQEAYSSDNRTFYSGPIPAGAFNYSPSTGVAVTLSAVTAGGWQAIASNSQTTRTCSIFLGNAPPLAPATNEGSPACN